jgi:hypothetical protein
VTTKAAGALRESQRRQLSLQTVQVATSVTRTQTVPQLFLWIDDEAWFVVIMEGQSPTNCFRALRE